MKSWFKRTPKASPPEVEPFDSWEITSTLSDDSEFTLNGYVYSQGGPDHAEVLRYVEAIADGLRQAGFPAEVSIIRKSRTTR